MMKRSGKRYQPTRHLWPLGNAMPQRHPCRAAGRAFTVRVTESNASRDTPSV
jgi:hypothetical protein